MKNFISRAPLLAPLLFVAACSTTTIDSAGAKPQGAAAGKVVQKGPASWYGPGFHGRKTASGERFNSSAMTAAHRTLPFGTKLRVVNEKNGRAVVVRVNDRGPFTGGRVIDLAKGPAEKLGMVASGVSYVSLYRVE